MTQAVGWSAETSRWAIGTVRDDIGAAEKRLTTRIDRIDDRLTKVERSVWAGVAIVGTALVALGWFLRPVLEAAAKTLLAGG